MGFRRPLIPTSAVAVAAVSLLTAGCGGGSSTTAATPAQNGLVRYSHCMHSHGVPNFPDPTSSGGIPKDKLVPLVHSPQFSGAQRACRHLMPASGLGRPTTTQSTRTRVAAEIAFARCIRTHGFPELPRPDHQRPDNPPDARQRRD